MKSSAAAPLQDVDLREAANVEDVELVARWVVEGFLHGIHRSPYVGFSVDFASHREYLPGDDLRHLNWKLFGRHDKLYIKQYDAETNVDLHLVLDVSGSMAARPSNEGFSKLRYAALTCAAMMQLAARQRDAVGLTLFADKVVAHHRAKATSEHRLALLSELTKRRDLPRADSARVLHEVAELLPRRGMVVVLSDFYYDTQELVGALEHFRHFGHDLLVFQVLDPVERGMGLEGAVRFVDQETGETLETLAHEIRASYQTAVAAWIEELHQACVARDIDHFVMEANQPLDRALFEYFIRRSQLF
jgi:uncharacterized protein (DUF58 family)